MPGELAKPVIRLQGRAAKLHDDKSPLLYKWGKEKRDIAELKSIADQLPGKSLTLDHPKTLFSSGGKAPIIGKVLTAHVDGDAVVVEFEVDGFDNADWIRNGFTQLSLGYACTTDSEGYQRLTTVDHLAVVTLARGGATLETRIDARFDACDAITMLDGTELASNTEVLYSNDVAETAHQEINVTKEIRMDETLDATQKALVEAQTKIAELTVRADAADLALHNAKKDLEKSEADKASEIKIYKDIVDVATTALETFKTRQDADDAARFDARVTEQVELLSKCNAILPEKLDIKISAKDAMLAVVKHVDGDDLADKSDEWIKGVFAGACKRHDKALASKAIEKLDADKSIEIASAALEATRAAGLKPKVNAEAAAKAKMNKESQTAYLRNGNK